MRLWHYKMIPVLPRKQLISQLRECVLIGKNLFEKGTPNHIIVNRAALYYHSSQDYAKYCKLLIDEIRNRGYNVSDKTIEKLNRYCKTDIEKLEVSELDILFEEFHNDRYLKQCYYNLQEKYDDGIIPEEEWKKLYDWYNSFSLTKC